MWSSLSSMASEIVEQTKEKVHEKAIQLASSSLNQLNKNNKDNENLHYNELDIYKKATEDLRSEKHKIVQEFQLMISQKDSEIEYLKNLLNKEKGIEISSTIEEINNIKNSSSIDSSLAKLETSELHLLIKKLRSEVDFFMNEINEYETKLSTINKLENNNSILNAKIAALNNVIENLNLKEIEKNETIENLVNEYSILSNENLNEINLLKEKNLNLINDNNLLNDQIIALNYNINLLADRATSSTSDSSSASNNNSLNYSDDYLNLEKELSEIKKRNLNLNFDLHEKEKVIQRLEQQLNLLKKLNQSSPLPLSPTNSSSSSPTTSVSSTKDLEEIERLTKELNDLKQLVEDHKKDRLELEEQLNTLRNEYENKIREYELTIDNLIKENNEKEKLREKEREIELLKQKEKESLSSSNENDITELINKISEANSKANEASAKLLEVKEEAEKQINEAKNKIEEAEKNAKEANIKVEESQSKLLEETKKVEEANIKVNETSIKLAEANSKITEATEKVSELSLQLDEANKKISQLNEDLKISNSSGNAGIEELNELKKKLNLLEKELVEKEQELNSANTKLSSLLDQSGSELNLQIELNTKLEHEVKKLEKDISNLQESLTLKEKEIEELKEKLENNINELQQKEESLKKKDEEIEILNKTHESNLQEKINEYKLILQKKEEELFDSLKKKEEELQELINSNEKILREKDEEFEKKLSSKDHENQIKIEEINQSHQIILQKKDEEFSTLTNNFNKIQSDFDQISLEKLQTQQKLEEIEINLSKMAALKEEALLKQQELEKKFEEVSQQLSETASQLSAVKNERDLAIKEKSDAISDRDEAILQRSEAYNQRDEAIKEKEIVESQLASAFKDRDEAIKEKNEANANYLLEKQQRKMLHNKLLEIQGNIRVLCRIRPINEIEKKSMQDVEVTEVLNTEELLINRDNMNKIKYEFDHIFNTNSTQEDIFEVVQPYILNALDGYNLCIFAYGQTGSGKTYTMEGYGGDHGVTPRAIMELFKQIELRKNNYTYSVSLNIIEIYNETIRDLLAPPAPKATSNAKTSTEVVENKLDIRQTPEGNIIPGLTEAKLSSSEEALVLIKSSMKNRSIDSHNMNEVSSRSHSIIILNVISKNLIDNKTYSSKINLIDLAGSERINKTEATGQRLKEAQFINKSLSCLGDVINSLNNKKNSFVPYRNSKLTFLLQDCLSGNSKVLSFVTISAASYNLGETICSLNFASRCRNTELGAAKKQVVNGPGPSSSSSTPSSSVNGSEPSTPRRLGSTINSLSSTKK